MKRQKGDFSEGCLTSIAFYAIVLSIILIVIVIKTIIYK